MKNFDFSNQHATIEKLQEQIPDIELQLKRESTNE